MIVALAGRRIDATDTETPRFPSALADSVRTKLTTCLNSVNAKHLVGSGACGADLLAMLSAEELRITKTMILPFNAQTFRSTSVTDRPGNWGLIYDKIIEQLKDSGQLIELNLDENDPEAYIKTNFYMLDHAQKIAEQIGTNHEQNNNASTNLMAVIVWEGKPKNTDDTTYHFMQEAQRRNFAIKEILTIPQTL